MQSPITGKEMRLIKEPGVNFSFRKEEFDITYHYFLCEDTGEQFTTEDFDRINLTQVHNKYREKYGIPFPDEIKEIRAKYNISASKMAEILGFGANSYRLYESGEIPSVANGRLILAIKDPRDFVKQIEASSYILSEKEKIKYIEHAEEILREQQRNVWEFLFTRQIFKHDNANEYSGYKKPDFLKIANIIRFFSDRIENVFKTKLNKLLFYSDFAFFKMTGYSISGITYRAIQMGPVPAEYHLLYCKLVEDKLIVLNQIPFNDGNYGEALVGLQNFDEGLFTSDELAVLNTVYNRFGQLNTADIIALSHEETAWVNNIGNKELISYSKYAFDLKNI